MFTVVTNNEDAPAGQVDGGSLIDEIVREDARRMPAAALEADVAAYVAGTPKITEVLPLYLHGLSTQDFAPALEGWLGTGAGPSAATITG